MLQIALIVFAKLPEPGRVKTRLLGPLTQRRAAELARACLADTVRHAGSIPGAQPWLGVAGECGQAAQLARALELDRRWQVFVQRGRNLGERLDFAFHGMFRAGCRKVVCVGTDTPWMGRARMVRAIELLDHAEVVLGPSDDGGYYLVGARREVPQIFNGIPWSTSRAFESTLRALGKARVSYRLLPRDFDLDLPEDLARAAALLRGNEDRAPALAQFLKGLEQDLARRSSRRRPRSRRSKKLRPGRV